MQEARVEESILEFRDQIDCIRNDSLKYARRATIKKKVNQWREFEGITRLAFQPKFPTIFCVADYGWLNFDLTY